MISLYVYSLDGLSTAMIPGYGPVLTYTTDPGSGAGTV